MATCPTCHAAYPPETVVCPADGTALGANLALATTSPGAPPPKKDGPDPLLGATVGKFNITRRIGEGGMGMVYEATHAVIGRPVALKVLHERYVERPEAAQRLMNEAKLAASIHHEHIVDIFDFGETADGRTFVVMELLDGESLTQRIRREGPLDEKKVIDVGLQIASALGAAHEKGIIHRDVKPENVFIIQRDGRDFVKVVDFGISKAIKLGPDGQPITPRLTQTGMVLGTPLYMSPEQARGEEDLDHRIDLYALGVILYECLTGEVPFRGANYLGIISQVLTEPPVPPRERAKDRAISEGMERVVLRALAKDRTQRYQSIEELAADLVRVRDGETVAPPPVAVERSGAVPSPRGRSIGLWAVAAMVLVAGGLTLAYVGRGPRALGPQAGAAAIPPAPAPQPPPLAPPPPATVVVRVESEPAGVEVRDGARVIGTVPGMITLPNSDQPVHLTFHKEGFVDGSSDVKATDYVNQVLPIKLVKEKPAHHAKARARPAANVPTGGEQLPMTAFPSSSPKKK